MSHNNSGKIAQYGNFSIKIGTNETSRKVDAETMKTRYSQNLRYGLKCEKMIWLGSGSLATDSEEISMPSAAKNGWKRWGAGLGLSVMLTFDSVASNK